jgi:uncharacterized membrane protein YsdA (DUF1294 family)
MITLPRISAARLLMFALTVAVGGAAGAFVAWLAHATRIGDPRAFWILYAIAMIAIVVAYVTGRRNLMAARAELERRRGATPHAHHSRL